MALRSKPLSRATNASVGTSGAAFDLAASGATQPITPTQIKVYVDAAAYVGVGQAASPPTAAATNSVYQEATTEEVYVLDGQIRYLYVYAQTGTLTARVSMFG